MSQTSPEIPLATPDPGRLYWLRVNLTTKLRSWWQRHRRALLLLVAALLVLALYFRAEWQPLALFVRLNLLPIAFFTFCLVLILSFRRFERRGKLLLALLLLFLLPTGVFFGQSIAQYLTLYLRFNSLDREDLSELPLTSNERIQPLRSIYALAFEAMTETEKPLPPNLVRVGEGFKWTMGIEPAYLFPRFFEGVGEIMAVPATSAAPDFSQVNRHKVAFSTGEDLLWGKRAKTATIRNFGFWRFLNYEADQLLYAQNDQGEWVQLVSLVRWRGLFFPVPEFGGVQLIRQSADSSLMESIQRLTVGSGEWIPAKQVAKKKFLQGQNLLSPKISRSIADSFRFQHGFWGPLPGVRKGDLRIPDLPDDLNPQPFTIYATLPGRPAGELFHYFGLEPYDPDKQGLNVSLFIPADGRSGVAVYSHADRHGALTGSSAIAAKVIESRKQYDWTRSRPVEHRPFIRQIAGQTRFFWLTTVVTLKEPAKGEQLAHGTAQHYIAGSLPDVVLTDARLNIPLWVDPRQPESWLPQLEKEIALVSKEGVVVPEGGNSN